MSDEELREMVGSGDSTGTDSADSKVAANEAADEGDGDLGKVIERLGRLEGRVVALERALLPVVGPVDEPSPGGDDAAADPASQSGWSVLLGRVATVCFVLIFALVLRVMSRKGVISLPLGTALGLGYCALLLASPLLLRRRRGESGLAVVLELCGALLASTIVVEAVRAGGPLSVLQGALVLLGLLGALAVLTALQRRSRLLGWGGLAVAAALVGLGWTEQALALRGGILVGLFALGLVLAKALDRPWLRPATMLPALLLVGGIVLVLARRPGVPPGVVSTLYLLVLATWLVAAVNEFFAKRPAGFERAIFPVATLWAWGLGLLGRTETTAVLGLLLGVGLVGVLARRDGEEGRPELLPVSAALCFGGGLRLDPTGIGLLVLALVLQRLGARRQLPRARSLSYGLLLGGLLSVVPAELTGNGGAPALPMSVLMAVPAALGVLAAIHFALELRAVRTASSPPFWAPAISLAGSSAAFLAAAQRMALALLGPGPVFSLARTLLLGLAAVAATLVARGLRYRPAAVLAILAVALLGAKVVLGDLVQLDGALVVASVLCLGASAGLVSLLLGPRL